MGHRDKGGRESQAYRTELRSPGCDHCRPGTSPSQPELRVGEGWGESPSVHTSLDCGETLGLPLGKPGPKLEGTDAPRKQSLSQGRGGRRRWTRPQAQSTLHAGPTGSPRSQPSVLGPTDGQGSGHTFLSQGPGSLEPLGRGPALPPTSASLSPLSAFSQAILSHQLCLLWTWNLCGRAQ